MGVLYFIANVTVSKSRHRLLFYPKGKAEKNRKDLSRLFLEFGGSIMKREGVSTLFICSYLRALSFLLDHLLLFENLLCVVFLKVFLKDTIV